MNAKIKTLRGPRPQRGVASILIVILVGAAISATAVGTIYTLKGSQHKQVAAHAATFAQSAAWAGVQALAEYLNLQTDADILGLPSAGDFNIEMNDNLVAKVKDLQVTGTPGDLKVSATVTAYHESAKSTAAIGVVYSVAGGSGPAPTNALPAALTFLDDLKITGGIVFKGEMGASNIVNVKGSIDVSNISLEKIHQLNVSGSVRLNSAVNINYIRSNENITLEQGASAGKVETTKEVSINGGGGIGVINANGKVTYAASGASTAINSLSDIYLRGGRHEQVTAGGKVIMDNSSLQRVTKISAVKDVEAGTWAQLDTIIGESSMKCVSNNWSGFTSISLNSGQPATCPTWSGNNKVKLNQKNKITLMKPIDPLVIPEIVIDVYPLKTSANYVYEYDAGLGRTKVTVNKVSGFADDSFFYIGDHNSNQRDYLCTAVNNGGKCTGPATMPICLGYSPQNNCLAYDVNAKRWTFTGTTMAPGVHWFKGNVKMNVGHYYATILATGDISGGDDLIVKSINYANYAKVCTAVTTDFDSTKNGRYKDSYQNYYPTQFCDRSTTPGTFISQPVGNLGLVAGGFDPGGSGVYSGGNISLGNSNKVYGTVLAGQLLNTSGASFIYGYVSAAAHQGTNLGDNSIGNRTEVDLSVVTDDYRPELIPEMGDGSGGGGGTGGGGGGTGGERVKLTWSRYL